MRVFFFFFGSSFLYSSCVLFGSLVLVFHLYITLCRLKKRDLVKAFDLCLENSSSLMIRELCSDLIHQKKHRRAKCQTILLFLSNPLNFLSEKDMFH